MYAQGADRSPGETASSTTAGRHHIEDEPVLDVSHAKLPDLIRGARQEVLCTVAGATAHIGARVVETLRSGTCAPQVRVRMLWSSCDEHRGPRISEVIRHRGQVRIASEATHDSLLIDRRLAVVPADRQQGSAGVLLAVTTRSLINALAESFTLRWAAATCWAANCGQPDEIERAVLRQLVVGQTDDAVAGKLGLSARTVRRHVNLLMERVGARSRFELGFRAAEFGWLESDLFTDREGGPADCGCRSHDQPAGARGAEAARQDR